MLFTLLIGQLVPGMHTPPAGHQMQPEREWAVLVGVSQYQNLPRSLWLDGCDNDASALAEFLKSPRGGSFPPDHVKLLVNEKATTTQIRLAMDKLIKSVKPGDVVYVFFACHGKVEAYGGGEVGYLLPYDADPEHLNATAIPMDEVRRYVDVNLRHAAQVVLITDACHAANLGPAERSPRYSISDFLLEVGERNGVLNIMACRRNEGAVEDPRLGGHGVLTYCLLKALNGEAAGLKDGTVRAQDVLEYIMRQVPRLTDQKQHPRHNANYHDEFPMARLSLPGPQLNLPEVPLDNSVASVNPTSLASSFGKASLRVVGAPADSELYLVQGSDQRTIGRVLSAANTLLLEGVPPGKYVLVQSLGGRQREWPIELTPGLQSFDLRAQ